MTPSGPQDHSNHAPDTSRAADATIRGDAEHYGFDFEAPERGRHGIRVFATGDDGVQTPIITLPPVAGCYQRGDGLVYLVPASRWVELYHAPAEELAKGIVWHKLGYTEAAEWTKQGGDTARLYWRVWHHVAQSWPVAPPSPRVTEARPPLAPTLAPRTEDEDASRAAWAWIGSQLTPTGRLIVGLALASPWIEETGGTSLVCHLWGVAGGGKSLAARVCAAVFGDSRLDEALFGGFNSAGQGIPSFAQALSYLPVILDEISSATGDVEPILTSLVTGASRKRASRSGAAVKNPSRWRGAVITTGNDPIMLRHEMYDRRLIEVQADEVWTPSPADPREAGQRWAQIARVLERLDGWPWEAFTREYEPGISAADVTAIVGEMPMPGTGSLALALRLATFGCAWLADWTGSPWDAGVHDAATVLVAARQAEILDPAADTATAILEDHVIYPGLWMTSEVYPTRELRGYRAHDVTDTCGVYHPDSECEWLNVMRPTFDSLAKASAQRLGRTSFRRAVYAPESGRLSRKVSGGAGRLRMVTACMRALEELAEGEGQAAPGGPSAPAAPPLPPLMLPVAAPEPAPAPAPAPAPEPEPAARRFAATTDDDETAGLDAAERAGVTDVVGPMRWLPDRLTGGWDADGWQGHGNGSGMIRRGDTAIRMWRAPNGHTSPEVFAEALAAWNAEAGQTFTSPANLVQRLLIGHTGGRTPRWQLPAEQAALWTPDAVMHPVGWGDRGADATCWDRNRSHLGAISQANLAPLWHGEVFAHHGGDAPISRARAGMYLIVVPEWTSPMPPPHGTVPTGAEMWTTAEVMRLYAEWGTVPRIIEAWLAPAHRVAAVEDAAGQLKTWLDGLGQPGRIIPKLAYQAFAGSIKSDFAKGKRHRVFRPDWGQAIADNSWCNVLRQVRRTYEADSRYVPVRVNVDAIYYPEHLPTPPPGMRLGVGLGEYKHEGTAA